MLKKLGLPNMEKAVNSLEIFLPFPKSLVSQEQLKGEEVGD